MILAGEQEVEDGKLFSLTIKQTCSTNSFKHFWNLWNSCVFLLKKARKCLGDVTQFRWQNQVFLVVVRDFKVCRGSFCSLSPKDYLYEVVQFWWEWLKFHYFLLKKEIGLTIARWLNSGISSDWGRYSVLDLTFI